MEIQRKNSLDSVSRQKFTKGAIISLASALTVVLLQEMLNYDFGQYTELIVACAGILINLIKVYRQGK